MLFIHETPTAELYTLSLHDALPIYRCEHGARDLHRLCLVDPEVLGEAMQERWPAHHLGPFIAMAHADRKSTRLNSSHPSISYAVFCLIKKNTGFTKLSQSRIS